jgi:hypothetical protein
MQEHPLTTNAAANGRDDAERVTADAAAQAAGTPHAPPLGVLASRDPGALLDHDTRRGRPPLEEATHGL